MIAARTASTATIPPRISQRRFLNSSSINIFSSSECRTLKGPMVCSLGFPASPFLRFLERPRENQIIMSLGAVLTAKWSQQ
jgi:hypothetical protein